MAIEYTYNTKEHRIQIESIQIFPAKKEVYIHGVIFDKATYDFRPFDYIIGKDDLGPVVSDIVALIRKAEIFVSNQETLDAFIDVDSIQNYTRPTLTLDVT